MYIDKISRFSHALLWKIDRALRRCSDSPEITFAIDAFILLRTHVPDDQNGTKIMEVLSQEGMFKSWSIAILGEESIFCRHRPAAQPRLSLCKASSLTDAMIPAR